MNDLISSDLKNIWHPFSPLKGGDDPIFIESAKGVYLHTKDGRKIIDAISSWWVNIHGHSNPAIAEAIAHQARTLEHVIFAGFTHEPAIQLAENLLKILPSSMEKIFFSDDGSTAVEVALKMAIQYWFNRGEKRTKIIALSGAYHGDTFGSMSVGDRNIFTAAFSNHLFETQYIDVPTHENSINVVTQFSELIKNDDVAAFIYEPLVQGAAGMRIYEAQTLQKLLLQAKKHDVICIADEVFTGFGRTGKMFASDYLSTKPDIMALSKGITGGTLPLGATVCSTKIVSSFESPELQKTFFHGHSFTANPLACAAANASFKLLNETSCIARIEEISKMHANFIEELKSFQNVKQCRSLGTILAIEINTTEATSYANNLRKITYQYFLKRNILLRPLGNVVYIVPPYVISNAELSLIYHAIKEFLGDLNSIAQ